MYFVWINDEDSIHRTGEQMIAIKSFRTNWNAVRSTLIFPKNGRSESGLPNMINGVLVLFTSFYHASVRDQHADTVFIVNKVTANGYRIGYITVSVENAGLASPHSCCLDFAKAPTAPALNSPMSLIMPTNISEKRATSWKNSNSFVMT